MLSFRRIAIFEPSLIFPHSFIASSDKRIASFSRSWADIALSHGADAWYFRLQEEGPLAQILKALERYQIPHLIPFPVRHLAKATDAIHYRSRDPLSPLPNHPGQCGRSCHNLTELQEAVSAGLDYVFYSPIFPTKSHPEAEGVGLEALKQFCTTSDLPTIALGGINPENEAECLAAGAQGIAGIRMFMD